MRKRFRKMTAILLIIVMIVLIIPFSVICASAITQSEFDNRLNNLRNQYPNYSTWYDSFDGGTQCFGFARLVAYNVFGSHVRDWEVSYSIDGVKAGDVLQYGNTSGSGHTVFVTSVTGDTITFVDCNGNGNYSGGTKVRTCGIKWDNTINKWGNMYGRGFSYRHVSPTIEPNEPDYPPTNVWLERSQEWYDINDTVKLIAHADNAQYFWITVHKDGQHLLTQKCDGELSFPSNQYGSGEYYAWITAYNSAGEKDSDGITFSVGGNPQYTTIYTSRAWYELTDTVSITVQTQKAKRQCLGIDKEGVGRIFTSDTDNTFNCSAMDLGVGKYSAYFSVYNDSGYIDTNRVEFSITDSIANYTDFHITKSCYNINETIEFAVTTQFSKRQIIGIDKVGQGRVLTKETDTMYYLSASELGVGEYTAYYSVYNDKGYTDTQLESFEIIDVKPSYTNVYVSKSKNLLSDIIQISVNPLYADKLVIGIDKEGVGRIITEETSDYYNISANKLGIGNYSAYFTLLNQKGYTDTHLITFSIVEQYSSVDLGDSFTALIKNTNNNKPIENSNENVVLSYEKHALNQLWHFKRNKDGTYTIISLFDNKALDVYNAGHENGCNIQVYDRNDSNAQKWYIIENDNGYNIIAKCAPSKTMDLKGNSPDDQTNIHIWECHGRDAQIFSIDSISDISIYLYGAKLGDTNLDGKITIRDVTAIQRHIAELEVFTDEQLALADTNGDGKVDISDATHLQKYLAEFNVALGKQS